MKLENQVCSLEIAKKLKELGVKQKSEFYWCDNCGGWDVFYKEYHHIGADDLIVDAIKSGYFEHHYSAFTVAELGEMLPVEWAEIVYNENGSEIWIEKSMGDDRVPFWEIRYFGTGSECLHQEDEENEANARAKMIIYLIENKLLQISKKK